MSTVRDMPELKTMPYLKLKRWMIANGCLKAEADRCDGKQALLRLWDQSNRQGNSSAVQAPATAPVTITSDTPAAPDNELEIELNATQFRAISNRSGDLTEGTEEPESPTLDSPKCSSSNCAPQILRLTATAIDNSDVLWEDEEEEEDLMQATLQRDILRLRKPSLATVDEEREIEDGAAAEMARSVPSARSIRLRSGTSADRAPPTDRASRKKGSASSPAALDGLDPAIQRTRKGSRGSAESRKRKVTGNCAVLVLIVCVRSGNPE